MKKFALAVLAVASLGVTAAVAGPIEDRQALMKGFAGPMKTATGLARGTAPYDAAAAKAAMDQLAAGGDKLVALFPKGSDTGATKTGAGPAIWSDAAGFKAEDVPHDDPLFLVALAGFIRRKAREREAGISGQLPGHDVQIEHD